MAGVKKLGLLWGERKLYFVETIDNAPARFISIPIASIEGATESGWDDILVFDRFVSTIQKTLHDERVAVTQVQCSVPNAMTVVRSFVIPQMSPTELASAVEFEVKKYLPFSLSELSFAYQVLPFSENSVRKNRIVFLACKFHFIDRLTKILEKAGLTVTFCEPGPLSFVRALQAKKIISSTAKAVVIQMEALTGRIMFVAEGIVLFMREFSLSVVTSPDMVPEDEQVVRSRFLNEVHNSIEFYNRSFYPEPVTDIHLLSLNPNHVFAQWLQQDLGVKVWEIDTASVLGTQPLEDQIPLLNAFGAAVSTDIKSKYAFNLIKKPAGAAAALFSTPTIDIWQYMRTLKTAAVCALVLGGLFFCTQMGISGAKADLEHIRSEQGTFADMTAQDIQEKVDKLTKSLTLYQSIPTKSALTGIVGRFSTLLPEAVWLKSVSLAMVQPSSDQAGSDPVAETEGQEATSAAPAAEAPKVAVQRRWSVHIEAYLYDEDPGKEIQEVNKFLNVLKSDSKMKQFFKDITLNKMQQEEINGHAVVSFELECS